MSEDRKITFGDAKVVVTVVLLALSVFMYVFSIQAQVKANTEQLSTHEEDMRILYEKIDKQNELLQNIRNDLTAVKGDVSWIRKQVVVEK